MVRVSSFEQRTLLCPSTQRVRDLIGGAHRGEGSFPNFSPVVEMAILCHLKMYDSFWDSVDMFLLSSLATFLEDQNVRVSWQVGPSPLCSMNIMLQPPNISLGSFERVPSLTRCRSCCRQKKPNATKDSPLMAGRSSNISGPFSPCFDFSFCSSRWQVATEVFPGADYQAPTTWCGTDHRHMAVFSCLLVRSMHVFF